jgi:hypothetical protein
VALVLDKEVATSLSIVSEEQLIAFLMKGPCPANSRSLAGPELTMVLKCGSLSLPKCGKLTTHVLGWVLNILKASRNVSPG